MGPDARPVDRRPTRRRATLALLAAACAAFGCARGAGDASLPTATAVAGGAETQVRDSSPLGWYVNDVGEQRTLLFSAEQALIARCMTAKGFPVGPWRYNGATAAETLRGEYGLLKASEAARFGYLDAGDREPAPVEIAPLAGTDVSAFYAALRGQVTSTSETLPPVTGAAGRAIASVEVPSGCVAEARTALFGSIESWGRYNDLDLQVQALRLSSYETLRTDERYVALQARWSSCMRQAGFPYGGVLDPLAGDWGSDDKRPSPKELRAAAADIRCKTSIQFLDEATRIRSDIEAAMLDASSSTIADTRRLWGEIAATARSVIGNG